MHVAKPALPYGPFCLLSIKGALHCVSLRADT